MQFPQKTQIGSWLGFIVRQVIVEVQPGETREDSWNRHLTDHPEDRYVTVRIFHRRKSAEPPLTSGNGGINCGRESLPEKGLP